MLLPNKAELMKEKIILLLFYLVIINYYYAAVTIILKTPPNKTESNNVPPNTRELLVNKCRWREDNHSNANKGLLNAHDRFSTQN